MDDVKPDAPAHQHSYADIVAGRAKDPVAEFKAGNDLSPEQEALAAKVVEDERLLKYDAESLLQINALADEVEEARVEMTGLRAKHDDAKKIHTGKAAELTELILSRKTKRHERPVRQLTIDDVQQQPEPATIADGKPVEHEDKSWRTVPIQALVKYGLKDKDVEKLLAGELKGGGSKPITDLGELVDFATPYPGNPSFARTIADLKGLGQAAVDRLAEANDKFWAAWSHHLQHEMMTPAERNDAEFWKLWNGHNAKKAKPEVAHADAPAPGVAAGGAEPGDAGAAGAAPAPVELHRLADDGGIAEPAPHAAPADDEGPFYGKFATQPAPDQAAG